MYFGQVRKENRVVHLFIKRRCLWRVRAIPFYYGNTGAEL